MAPLLLKVGKIWISRKFLFLGKKFWYETSYPKNFTPLSSAVTHHISWGDISFDTSCVNIFEIDPFIFEKLNVALILRKLITEKWIEANSMKKLLSEVFLTLFEISGISNSYFYYYYYYYYYSWTILCDSSSRFCRFSRVNYWLQGFPHDEIDWCVIRWPLLSIFQIGKRSLKNCHTRTLKCGGTPSCYFIFL